MTFGHRHDRSFPELLAAYADGELDAAARARVEAWLATHPDARTALDGQRKLSARNRRLWRAAAAPNPGEANWERVLGHVQDALDAPALPSPSPAPARRQRRWGWLAIPTFSTAAAAAIAVGLLFSGGDPTTITQSNSTIPSDIFVIASVADVDIISLDDRDASVLVIGQPPLSGVIVLAAAGDVTLRGVQKDTDGMLPKVQMNEAGLAPMIIAPIAGR